MSLAGRFPFIWDSVSNSALTKATFSVFLEAKAHFFLFSWGNLPGSLPLPLPRQGVHTSYRRHPAETHALPQNVWRVCKELRQGHGAAEAVDRPFSSVQGHHTGDTSTDSPRSLQDLTKEK